LSDNLYYLKAWVTCTSHVHEDTSLKTRQIKVKKTRYKIINDQVKINQSTHFINELIYLNFVTVMSPVRRLKKLVSYYSIIWRNSTSSSRRRLWQKSYHKCHRTILTRTFHEILRDSTSIVTGRLWWQGRSWRQGRS